MPSIVWHSNAPWVGTGYGQQTAIFTPRIRDAGYDVSISAFWGLGGSQLEYDGMQVYPADEKWGNRNLAQIAADNGGEECLVITLMDVWVLTSPLLSKLKLASWVPVDHDPLPPKVAAFFRETGSRPIAMSRFGQRKLAEAGFDPLYVPHGIETDIYKPLPEVRADAREVMGIPQDAFVLGMNAANKGMTPPRKAFPQVFQAFARFLKECPDAYLYLHTELSGVYDGINLGHLASICGIPSERVKQTPPWRYDLGIPPEGLAQIYSAWDELLNPSYDEGFGIPIIEAQACGIPVIVTDHSSMRELCGSGWLVGGDPYYNATQGSFYRCPSVGDIHKAMRDAYEARDDQGMKDTAREFALQYDADAVMAEYWTPALKALEAHTPKPAELKPIAA